MKLIGLEGASLEITDAKDPSDEDMRLLVRVELRGFSGEARAWIHVDSWSAFLGELARLEGTRHGSASIEAMSPNVLQLTLRSTDSAGHMAVDGFVGAPETKLAFSALELDPTDLPRVLRELQAMGEKAR